MKMPSKELIQDFLKAACTFALSGGEVLRQYWGKLQEGSVKEKQYFWDLVTIADTASEKVILDLLKQRFPKHQTLSEEAGLATIEEEEYLWVIDPLDGTTNFTHQYPMVAVSIGLLHRGVPIVGAIYNPIYDELYSAGLGLGAYLHQQRIQVSAVDRLSKSLLGTGFAYDRKENADNNYSEFCHLTHHSQGVRRSGSAALDLAYVAMGRLDGFWERGLKPWDLAAGVILVQEAQGRVSSYEGGALDLYSGRVLATNGIIHEALSRELDRGRIRKEQDI